MLFYAVDKGKQYEQGEILAKYHDSEIKEDYITDILVFRDQKFFITAHNMGDIRLRKLVELNGLEFQMTE